MYYHIFYIIYYKYVFLIYCILNIEYIDSIYILYFNINILFISIVIIYSILNIYIMYIFHKYIISLYGIDIVYTYIYIYIYIDYINICYV